MREIQLTKGKVAVVDDGDYEALAGYPWQAIFVKKWYARRQEYRDGKVVRVYMHRQIAGTPKGLQTDHIDGDTLNNRRANLRIVTPAQNSMNRAKTSGAKISPYKGVFRHNKKWRAEIRIAGAKYRSVVFDRPEDAALAYDNLARKHHGEFARLNFPS